MKKIIVVLFLLIFMLVPMVAYAEQASQVGDIENMDAEKILYERLDGLKNNTNWIDAFKVDVWDCSNQASFLSTIVLYDFETKIVEGKRQISTNMVGLPDKTVFEPVYDLHAMVKVKLSDRWVYVNPPDLDVFTYVYDFKEGSIVEFNDYRQAIKHHGKEGITEYGLNIYYIMDEVLKHAEIDKR